MHLEILDKKRLAYFEKLALFKKVGFLAGGTALALQAGHRISFDFDVFISKKISRNFPLTLRNIFPIKDILLNNQDEFTFMTKDSVKISFILYPFDLGKHIVHLKHSIPLLSVKGIGITKAYTLNRWESWRDYLDMYYVLKSKKSSLSIIILAAKRIYKEMFSEKLFLSQLLYTDNIPASEMKNTRLLKESLAPGEIKKFFEKEIEKYMG